VLIVSLAQGELWHRFPKLAGPDSAAMWDMITAVLVCWLVLVQANVEKTIFVTPAAQVLPHDASIDNLYLTRLSERVPRVRTYINATFPTPDEPKGTETWMLLEELRPKTRYEVRLCWLATVSLLRRRRILHVDPFSNRHLSRSILTR